MPLTEFSCFQLLNHLFSPWYLKLLPILHVRKVRLRLLITQLIRIKQTNNGETGLFYSFEPGSLCNLAWICLLSDGIKDMLHLALSTKPVATPAYLPACVRASPHHTHTFFI